MASSAPDHLRTPGLISNRPCYEGIKLDSSGSFLVYSTYLGDNGVDYGYDIDVNSDEEAYVTG